jgi:hypothetical protein
MKERLGRLLLRWGHRLTGDGTQVGPDRHEWNIVRMREVTTKASEVTRAKARPSGNPVGDAIARRRAEVRRHG